MLIKINFVNSFHHHIKEKMWSVILGPKKLKKSNPSSNTTQTNKFLAEMFKNNL